MSGKQRPTSTEGKGRMVLASVAVLVVLVAVVSIGWLHHTSAPFPVKHQRGDNIITQTKALFDSDPDQAQAALDRSGRKDITLDIQKDPGIYKITEIQVNRDGMTYRFDRPENCSDFSPEIQGSCIDLLVGPENFKDIDNSFAEVSVTVNQSVLDKNTRHKAAKTGIPRKELENNARQVVNNTLATLASHWPSNQP